MMVAFAAVGSGLAALNVSEKAKMEERLMVQRLRNQGIVPSASVRPPAGSRGSASSSESISSVAHLHTASRATAAALPEVCAAPADPRVR